MGPEIGDVWTTRVFRDDTLRLRLFKLAQFGNLSIGVIDMEDPVNFEKSTEYLDKIVQRQKVIWFGKADLQFFDLISKEAKAAANEESAGSQGSKEGAGDRGSDKGPRRGGQPGNDAGIRKERDR